MFLRRLAAENLRNLKGPLLDFRHDEALPQFVVLQGPNGSGKSSILEAIHMLCRGKSWRTSELNQIIHHDAQQCSVFGEFCDHSCIAKGLIKIGMGKARAEPVRLLADGSPLQRLSQLSARLPILMLNPEMMSLLVGQPEGRRRFLDWSLFHVKQDYHEAWQRWRKMLQQRNQLLKSLRHRQATADHLEQLSIWSDLFVESSDLVRSFHEQHLQSLWDIFLHIWPVSEQIKGSAELVYRPGHAQAYANLSQALRESRETELKQGFTQCGPQKADWELQVEGRPAKGFFSRGEQKKVIIYLYLAQLQVLNAATQKQPLVLLDDLASELDQPNQKIFLEALSEAGCQVFLTVLETQQLKALSELCVSGDNLDVRVFHVEQGQLATA